MDRAVASGAIAEAIVSLFSKLRIRQKEVSLAISGHSVIIKKILDYLKKKDEATEPSPLPESRASAAGLLFD